MKRENRMTPEAAVIGSNMDLNLIKTQKELAERIGLTPQLMGVRFVKPGGIRLYELRAIINELNMPDEDILAVVKGVLPVKEKKDGKGK